MSEDEVRLEVAFNALEAVQRGDGFFEWTGGHRQRPFVPIRLFHFEVEISSFSLLAGMLSLGKLPTCDSSVR